MSVYIQTLDEAKADLGITDTADNAVLTDCMESLQGRIEEHLQRTLLRGTYTEVHDGGVRALQVKAIPIESIASIHISSDQTWDADTLLDSSDYRYKADRGLIWYGDGTYQWTAGVQNIRVVYVGAYVAAGSNPSGVQLAMPEAIRDAFRLQLGFEWRNRRTLGQQSVSMNGQAVSLAPAKWLPAAEAALQPYARVI